MKPFISLAAILTLLGGVMFAPHTLGGFLFLIGSLFVCVPLALLPMLDVK